MYVTARGLLLVSQNLFQNCGRTAQHVEEQTPFAATREKSAQKQARPSTATIQLKKKKMVTETRKQSCMKSMKEVLVEERRGSERWD